MRHQVVDYGGRGHNLLQKAPLTQWLFRQAIVAQRLPPRGGVPFAPLALVIRHSTGLPPVDETSRHGCAE